MGSEKSADHAWDLLSNWLCVMQLEPGFIRLAFGAN